MFSFSVAKWKPWLERVQPEGTRDPFPIERALKWIEMESGGNVCAVGRVDNGHVYEAGLAQTYFLTPSSVAFGVTVAQLRAKCGGATKAPTNLTDEDRLLHARVALDTCKAERAKARKKLLANGVSLAENSADFWCFVKLAHAAPAMFDYLPHAKRNVGWFPSWREFRRFVDSQSYEQLKAVNSGIASRVWRLGDGGTRVRTDYLTRVWRNCEEFGGANGFVELQLALILALAALALAHFVF